MKEKSEIKLTEISRPKPRLFETKDGWKVTYGWIGELFLEEYTNQVKGHYSIWMPIGLNYIKKAGKAEKLKNQEKKFSDDRE